MDSEILQEISSDEIPRILEVLKKDWPKHFLLHQYITIMEQYKESKPEFSQNIYRRGTIEEGVYVVTTLFLIRNHVHTNLFVYTPNEDLAEMSGALMETSRIPWSGDMFLFEVTFSKFSPLVDRAGAARGAKLLSADNYMLWLPPEDHIDERPLPEGLCIKHLEESNIPEIDQNWPHRFAGSEEYLSQELRANFGLGLFRKSDGKMLSSCLHFHSGGIFVLYTDQESRGKGYAQIVVCSMVKEIRQRGRIPFCTILKENIPSQKLFRKIGFKDFTSVNFIFPGRLQK